MGGHGYLQVKGSKISVADIEKAYGALKEAVVGRTYNFGELRLGKNNQLEIINNHKHSFLFINQNNTITSEEENSQVREAVSAILDAKFGGVADANKLALVKAFLCGDTTIASQPLTRDEVANMIELLDGSTERDDSAVEFLRASYDLKHGHVDSRFEDKFSRFSRASENRISVNVQQANEKQLIKQQAELRNSLVAMLPKNIWGPAPDDGPILKKVFAHVLTNQAANNPAVRMIASQSNPTRLSGSGDIHAYFMDAVANYACNSIHMSPFGGKFLSNMVMQGAVERIKALGGNNQVVAMCMRGRYNGAFESMRIDALNNLAKGDWGTIADDFAAAGAPPLLGEFAELASELTNDSAELTKNAAQFRSKLAADFGDLTAKLASIDPKEKPADYLAAFATVSSTFKMDDTVDSAIFRADWKKGLGDMLRAFFDGGGNMGKARAALDGLKEMLRGKLGQLNDELVKIKKTAEDDKKQFIKEQVEQRNEIDLKAAASRANCLRRAKPLAEASTLVAFLDTLMESDSGKAYDLLKTLTFFSYGDVSPSVRTSSFEKAVIADMLADSKEVNSEVEKYFETRFSYELNGCLNSGFGEKEVDTLVQECTNRVESFCLEVLDKVKWSSRFANPHPIADAVYDGAKDLVNSYRENVKDEAKAAEFSELCGKFFGNDTQAVKQEKKILANEEHQTEIAKYKEIVTSVDPTAVERLVKLNSGFGDDVSEIADEQLEYFSRLCGEQVTETNAETNVTHVVTDEERIRNVKSARYADLRQAQENIIAEIDRKTNDASKFGSGFVDSVRLLQSAIRLPDSLDAHAMPNELTVGIDPNLKHFKILIGDVARAFNQPDSVEQNVKALAAVYGKFQDEFGMSKDEARRFVDPVCVAIIANAHVPPETQSEMILRCAIAKAKGVYADKNAKPADKDAAHVLLWKMQSAVTLAQEHLAPLRNLITERKDIAKEAANKLKQNAVSEVDEQPNPAQEKLNTIDNLFLNRASESPEAYMLVGKKNRKKTVSIDQTDKKAEFRATESKNFWNQAEAFLMRLERLSWTLNGEDGKNMVDPSKTPKNADSESRKFVANAKSRFGGKPLVNPENGNVNEESFAQLIGSTKEGSIRPDYSLSFNFK